MKVNWSTVWKYTKLVLVGLAMALILDEFIYHGMIGFAVIIVCWLGYKLIKNRQSYVQSMRMVETKVWGKPLDPQFWKPGEWKNTKVKVRWKKPKEK